MERLWSVYHKEIPPFLREFAVTPPMRRLMDVGMNCGCEYTAFPRFAGLRPYSRFHHSMGAALIVWHFTQDKAQSLAALFHDVTTPVFAHVVDFMGGDHLRQESTEAGVEDCLAASAEICTLLKRYGISLDAVSDYHRYPVADNESPALSADRLEYTMGNLLNYRFASLEEIAEMYDDLTVGTDERGAPELVFQTAQTALKFARLSLKNSHVYVADEDRFAMEALALLLRQALKRGVLTAADLMTTEPQVIAKLKADAVCAVAWGRFCGYSEILRSEEKPADGFWVQVNAKKRWIDPLAAERGRVSGWDAAAREEMEAFQQLDFSHWLGAT